MSPRQLYRLCLGILFVIVLGVCTYVFWPASPTAEGSKNRMDTASRALLDKAEVNRGSVLSIGGQAIEYALPASAYMVRLSTNANLKSLDAARRERQADPTRRWTYALEIEEFSLSGEKLHQRIVHFQRDLVEVEMPGGTRGTGVFYLADQAPKPLASATVRIDFSGNVKPAKLRIRLIEADPEIADILLRLHVPEPVSPRNAEAVWQRLSEEQRTRLASGNVFPSELLVEQERNNIVASRWRALGPTGEAVGRDIYVLPSMELGAPSEPLKPAAVTAGPEHHAMIQLPEQGGKIRLVLDPVDTGNDANGAADAAVQVSWFGHSAFERDSQTYQWKDKSFELNKEFGGGWLRVASTRNAIVRVWHDESGQQKEITPPIRYLRVYPADKKSPVEYEITHVEGKPTPVRLLMRRFAKTGEKVATTPVEVSFLDATGKVVRTDTLNPEWVPSLFDQQWSEIPGSTVTDPVEVFFNVPAQVQRLRIESDDAIAVVAFTRPGDLPRAVRTPEDTVSPESEKQAIPGWFALQPSGFQSQILNGATRLLAVQERPPEDRPNLAAGQYFWEDFQPVSGGATRVFFAPREPGIPDRADAAGVTYRPVPANGQVHFVAEPGRGQIAPRLAWVSKREHTFRFGVSIDLQHWADGAATGIVGELILPALRPGHHHVKIRGGRDADWFITHLDRGPAWVKRSAQRFEQRLQFDINRSTSDEEFISVRLFRPAGVQNRMKVRVWVDAPKPADPVGPMAGWLFTERIHDIRPSGQYALPVAETAGERSDAGQPFYIPFPKGSPHGRYRITLIPEGGEGWISVSRILPGRYAKPRLFIEEVQRER